MNTNTVWIQILYEYQYCVNTNIVWIPILYQYQYCINTNTVSIPILYQYQYCINANTVSRQNNLDQGSLHCTLYANTWLYITHDLYIYMYVTLYFVRHTSRHNVITTRYIISHDISSIFLQTTHSVFFTFDAENEKNGKNKIESRASGLETQTAPRTARRHPDFKKRKKSFFW